MNEEWLSQIKRGTLEFVILSLIQQKERYGYDIIHTLDGYPMLQTKESTIYPLLRRLLKNGYLESYWQTIGEGVPPRKYYKMTAKGNGYLTQLSRDWEILVQTITELRKDEN